MSYVRVQDGIKTEWRPDDDALKAEVLAEFSVEAGEQIDAETAVKIRERYKELHLNKYGEKSGFYDANE